MARDLTTEQIAALLANNKAAPVIVDTPLRCVEVYTSQFDENPDFRAVANRQFYRIGTQLYRQRPFHYILPEEGDRDLPRSQLVIPRTAAPKLLERVRNREDYRGRVILRLVLESDASEIWRVENSMESVTVTNDTIAFTLGNTAEFERRFSRIIFNPQRAPGVF